MTLNMREGGKRRRGEEREGQVEGVVGRRREKGSGTG